MLNFLKNRRVEKQQQKVDALMRDIAAIQAMQEPTNARSWQDEHESIMNSFKEAKRADPT